MSKDNEELIAEAREKLRLAEEQRDEGSFEALDLWKGVATEYAPRLADALEAATRVPVQGEPNDARKHLHAKCDCVPDLGPAHCHLCGNVKGSQVPWPECEAVTSAVPDATTQLAQSLAMATTLTGSDATVIAKAALEVGGIIRNETTAAVGRVREIHAPGKIIDVWGKSRSQADDFLVCVECTDPDNNWCAYPCPTIALLDGKE